MSTEASKDVKMREKQFNDFQKLRSEQKNLVNSLNTLEMDRREHKTVIETLKTVEPERKCFRLVGGVLFERTVKEILPQVENNIKFLEKTIEQVNKDLATKIKELNQFKQEHNFKINSENFGTDTQKSTEDQNNAKTENRNVLVSN